MSVQSFPSLQFWSEWRPVVCSFSSSSHHNFILHHHILLLTFFWPQPKTCKVSIATAVNNPFLNGSLVVFGRAASWRKSSLEKQEVLPLFGSQFRSHFGPVPASSWQFRHSHGGPPAVSRDWNRKCIQGTWTLTWSLPRVPLLPGRNTHHFGGLGLEMNPRNLKSDPVSSLPRSHILGDLLQISSTAAPLLTGQRQG